MTTDAVTHHAAILALVDEYIASADADDYPVRIPLEALRRTVELHEPFVRGYVGVYCRACSVPVDDGGVRYHFLADWSCSTIKAIAGALGVDLNG